MKKLIIALSCIILAMTLLLTGQIVYNLLNRTELGISDRTDNINTMLTRPENWRKVVTSPVISLSDMQKLIDGSTATIPVTAEILRQFFDYTDEQVNTSEYVFHSTTHNAYMNLFQRNSKIILATYPSQEEFRLAEEYFTELDIQPIAKDGFVFITHKDNPINSLTKEQVQKIYTGEITNWKELGGEDLEIRAYQREQNSGSQTAMEEMVMEGKSMTNPISAKTHMGMGALIDAVAEYENGRASIGYTYYYYVNNLYKNEDIKVLKIDGVSPENENLISGTYAYSTNYYAVIRKDEEENSAARKLRDFLLTTEGQELIEMAGYCKVW